MYSYNKKEKVKDTQEIDMILKIKSANIARKGMEYNKYWYFLGILSNNNGAYFFTWLICSSIVEVVLKFIKF